MAMSDPSKARIAIKFGTSTATKPSSSQKQPQSHLGKRPTSTAWAQGSESEDSDQGGEKQRHEKITGFDADGAQTTSRHHREQKTSKKEYLIQRQPNRDWKAEARAHRHGGERRNLLPPEARAQKGGQETETAPADQDAGIKWGLTVKEKTSLPNGSSARNGASDAPNDATLTPNITTSSSSSPPLRDQNRSADQEALDALLGNEPRTAPKTILSEQDALERDLQTAGEMSTLEDYEAMPVEEFGAALLRGMGWDGEDRGPKVKQVKKRPNRMGLGAKELKGDEDLGSWDQKGGKKQKRPRLDEYRREEERRREKKRERDTHENGRRDRDEHRRREERDYERRRDRDRNDRDRRR